jgi:hypothetical protein
LGGSTANYRLAYLRGACGIKNRPYNKEPSWTKDPYADKALEKKSVQILTIWDPNQNKPQEMLRKIPSFMKNHELDLGPYAERTVFYVGGLLDIKSDLIANQKVKHPLSEKQLAIKWAKNLFAILRETRKKHLGDVFYLGCGVAKNQPSMGSWIYIFNGTLLQLIDEENRKEAVSYPQIHFQDIYSPAEHAPWQRKCLIGSDISWEEEPKQWISRFWQLCQPFVAQKCYAAAMGRENRIKKDPKFAAQVAKLGPVVKKKPATGNVEKVGKKKISSEPSCSAD